MKAAAGFHSKAPLYCEHVQLSGVTPLPSDDLQHDSSGSEQQLKRNRRRDGTGPEELHSLAADTNSFVTHV